MDLDTFLAGYLEYAVWSSTDDEGEPLDRQHSADDIAPESLDWCRAECAAFLESNAGLLECAELTTHEAGGLFWLSRCGHGSGYFDRGDHPCFGELQSASRACGERWLYVGDDGMLHVG